jgi:hypothetical protein
LAFLVRNFNVNNQTITFKWNQELRDQFNLRVPVNDLPTFVLGRNDHIVFRATKLRPAEPWGPLDKLFEIEVVDPYRVQPN